MLAMSDAIILVRMKKNKLLLDCAHRKLHPCRKVSPGAAYVTMLHKRFGSNPLDLYVVDSMLPPLRWYFR
jgi:hypothetical protein